MIWVACMASFSRQRASSALPFTPVMLACLRALGMQLRDKLKRCFVSSQVAVAEQKADAELDLLMRDLSGYDKPPSKADLLKIPLM